MIIIQSGTKPLTTGKTNPKHYPFWDELIPMIDDHIVQIGVEGDTKLVEDFRPNLPFKELFKLLGECKSWIGTDSFFQHFAWQCGKPGIVLWGKSDPVIFGHPENTNLLKSRDNLRSHQFLTWEEDEWNPNVFVEPRVVINHLQSY